MARRKTSKNWVHNTYESSLGNICGTNRSIQLNLNMLSATKISVEMVHPNRNRGLKQPI